MKNMSRYSKIILLAAALLCIVSCGRTARIDGTIEQLAGSHAIVKLLDINRFTTLDTVTVDNSGRFTYKVDAAKGQPEFVYIFNGDVKIASLVLEGGDKVAVTADTLGNYSVEGSQESLMLQQVEVDYASALKRMTDIASRIESASDPQQAVALRQELGQEYIAYYRDRVRYVMQNSRSISVVPVFYQTFGTNLPVFGQSTDAIHFRNVADSLSLAYPASRYVKALRQEADRRFGYLELENRLRNAEEVGYPDIELPDLKGEKRRLSEIDSKVIMIHFWTASDADQKMFNLDTLMPLYNEFHDKGFEIYQVSLDIDKGLWAQVVKEQKHPWVSVCDSRGTSSPYATTYNLPSLPATFIIADGQLVDGSVVDDKSLRRLLRKLLF